MDQPVTICGDFSEAFEYCREKDRPIVVKIIGDGEFKLFPSGKATRLTIDKDSTWQNPFPQTHR